MKKSHNRLVTKIFYDYNNFMHYRDVRFGNKLDYHYKEKLSDINKKILINYPLNYPTVIIYELGKRKIYKRGSPNEKKTKSIQDRVVYLSGDWTEFICETYITKDTTSFKLYDVKDYKDLINKLILFYKKYRNNQRCLTNLECVNESKYKNPKRKGFYPENHFVLEYIEDDGF